MKTQQLSLVTHIYWTYILDAVFQHFYKSFLTRSTQQSKIGAKIFPFYKLKQREV